MKYLGLDLGTKTLGLALSDKLGIISSPYKTLFYNDYKDLILELKNIIQCEQVDVLVLGMPKNMNNSIGKRAEETLNFSNLLQNEISLPLYLVDERLSTVEAENLLISGDVRRKNRKKVIDSIAASIILETFLERNKNEQN